MILKPSGSRKKEQSNLRGQNLLVLTGFSCNNNCLMCSVRDRGSFYADRKYEAVVDDLKKGRENGFDWVEFTGGEPTIRRDIIDLVKKAKELGYKKIAVSTNGRIFSYFGFCEKIIRAGLNKITFSVLGPNKKVHEALTRTPGSFEEIITGIKNVQKFLGVHINVSSVISRLNYKPIVSFGRFIQSLGIKHWYLLDLIPDSNAKKFYKHLVVRLPELSREMNSLKKISSNFKEFGFFDFPLCIFKPELISLKNICLVNAKARLDTTQQVGYDPKRIEVNKEGIYCDVYRQNVDICLRCIYYKDCGGVWREYINYFGDSEIKKIALKNNCLKL